MIWSSTLSAQDNSVLDHAAVLFQNPVKNGQIYLGGKSISNISTAQIYSITGQLLQTVNNPFKNGNSIHLKNAKPGMYILKLDNQTIKFLVE